MPEPINALIRPATAADAPGIAEVHVASWRATYEGLLPDAFLASLSVEQRTADWRQYIGEERYSTIVAARADRIIGFSNYGPSRDEDGDASTGEVNAIYLDPSEWGRGVGRELWLRSSRALSEAGFQTITLWVLDSNERARRFYEQAGFTVDGATKVERTDGGVELCEVRYRRSVAGE